MDTSVELSLFSVLTVKPKPKPKPRPSNISGNHGSSMNVEISACDHGRAAKKGRPLQVQEKQKKLQEVDDTEEVMAWKTMGRDGCGWSHSLRSDGVWS